MLRELVAISVVLLTTFSTSIAASEPKMREGKWKITTRTEMVGMSVSMPAVTHTQCLTKKDFVPKDSQPGQECKITNTEADGNIVTWTVKCSGQGGEMTGVGKIIYSGDSLKGTFEMTVTPSNMKMISHMNGQRLGDCR